jgi:hypothetical protein
MYNYQPTFLFYHYKDSQKYLNVSQKYFLKIHRNGFLFLTQKKEIHFYSLFSKKLFPRINLVKLKQTSVSNIGKHSKLKSW